MKYYVYVHILPETGEILYVGMGAGERAWTRQSRKGPHKQILKNLDHMGYTADDYVLVVAKGLQRGEAQELEDQLLQKMQPILNQRFKGAVTIARGVTAPTAKLTEDAVLAIRSEYATGQVTMRVLGAKYGVDSSTISGVVNRESWTHI
ncbi:hypothetical protein HJJEPNFP_00013 [Ralstonia phage BOESR1]|uniref:GIY-YIG domain-containing protein n=1 Tax=Ralstonia phage BOESR1 TaxID=3034917 RepID=A0AA50IHG4_9CAUD|nr:hypothetical protein HJJEPNFP_00013 [Ralstonia phage BOESR1]WLW40591.1 hypothetical protein HIBIKMCM_00024 [Ralstonia phage BOESR1]